MKAVQINRYGGIDVLAINDVPKPSISEEQVLVAIHAASINPFDYKIRSGYLKENIPLKFPTTMGGDFAGMVEEVSGSVSDFKTGDKVYGQAIVLSGGSGSFAEFATAGITQIAHMPTTINFSAAAALPLAGSSALQALEDHIKLTTGQKILIHGGAGGIGHIAIQLANSLGAYVITTVGADDMDFVKNLGAMQVIDYKNEDFEKMVKDLDAVFDLVGGETTNKSFAVLKKGGIMVSMLGQPDQELAQKYGIVAVGQGTHTNTQHLNRLAQLADSGKVKVHIDRQFALEEVQAAFKYQEEDHPHGKVVLKIK